MVFFWVSLDLCFSTIIFVIALIAVKLFAA